MEEIELLNQGNLCDNVLWVMSQKYFTSTDDQSNRLLMLVEAKASNLDASTSCEIVAHHLINYNLMSHKITLHYNLRNIIFYHAKLSRKNLSE